MRNEWRILALLTGLYATTLWATQNATPPAESLVEKARYLAREGNIVGQLTTPEALKALLGPPQSEEKNLDADPETLVLRYGELTARFSRSTDHLTPFLLQTLTTAPGRLGSLLGRTTGRDIEIGRAEQVVLRSPADLAQCNPMWGVASVSLVGLDLREHETTLAKMPFDTRTLWPPRDRLPEGFDPARRLEEGKNPGLGVRALHAQGIDGRGVGIAIIDQPLWRNHQEYARQLVRYEAIGVEGVDPQMHGPPVCSIAVGVQCGVAPRAALYSYAVPCGKWQDNQPWAEQIDKIIELNETLTDQPKIRVVSISSGMFSQWPHFDLWKAAVAKAAQNGILVVTCGNTSTSLTPLRSDPSGDPNDPACYRPGRSPRPDALGVPAGNRTTASHHGPPSLRTGRGRMSWGVPYMAGLAHWLPARSESSRRVKDVDPPPQRPRVDVVNPLGSSKQCFSSGQRRINYATQGPRAGNSFGWHRQAQLRAGLRGHLAAPCQGVALESRAAARDTSHRHGLRPWRCHPLGCHCEERRDEAISIPDRIASLRLQ